LGAVFDAGARINTGFHDVMFGATIEGLSPMNFYALYAKAVEFQGLARISAVPTTTGNAYTNQEFSTALVSPGPIAVPVHPDEAVLGSTQRTARSLRFSNCATGFASTPPGLNLLNLDGASTLAS
jgi:hypothetical protein